MIAEVATLALLNASSGLLEVVGEHIFPERPPVVEIDGVVSFETPLPFLVYSKNDQQDAYDLEGNDLGLHVWEMMIDVWTKDALANYQLAELVKTALRVRNANVRLVKLLSYIAIEDELGYHGQQIYSITWKD